MSDFEIVGYKSKEANESGIVFMSYMPVMTVDGVVDTQYSRFMSQYREQHKYCPKCGGELGVRTLLGYTYKVGAEDDYKNLNSFRCSCGHKHTVHDRVALPPKVNWDIAVDWNKVEKMDLRKEPREDFECNFESKGE